MGGHSQTYLKEKGIENKLITFRGHWFNHLFYAAGATFFHLNDIKDFLAKWADPNDLFKSVQCDVEELVYVSGTRTLGIKGAIEWVYILALLCYRMPQWRLQINEMARQPMSCSWHFTCKLLLSSSISTIYLSSKKK